MSINPKVAILMGSDSDLEVMKKAAESLGGFWHRIRNDNYFGASHTAENV